MSSIEQTLIEHHHSQGDNKIRLWREMNTSTGMLYLVRFYDSTGSCYSSVDKIDEGGVVSEVKRCHRLDEGKMLKSIR